MMIKIMIKIDLIDSYKMDNPIILTIHMFF